MPDLPTRQQREKEMAIAIFLLFQAGDFSPDELAAAVVPTLAATHAEAAAQLAELQGLVASPAEIQEKSQQWAENHGLALGAEVVQTTESGLLQGKSRAEMLSRDRASMIAATEVTRAVTVGESLILVMLLAETGKELIPVWYTEMDARVCPICAPLHGTGPPTWRRIAEGGPPAHPNCRCHLTYEAA